MKKLAVWLFMCIFVATSLFTTSCSGITPLTGFLILGAAGLVAMTAFDESSKVDLTVVNLTGNPAQVWIDFELVGTVQPGSTGVFPVNLGTHTLQAGETVPVFNKIHDFIPNQPFTWTLQ